MARLSEALTEKTLALVWNEAFAKPFHDTKKSLADATLLTHPCQNAPISLTKDTSDLALGAVLQWYVTESWLPQAFFSEKL